MTQRDSQELRFVRRALLSVSDKTKLTDFARSLRDFGIELISTGGTAKALRDDGIEVREVSDLTGFPEMLDGRIKTLHPRIHGALLAVRDNALHIEALREQNIELIDMVVINLYPFEETIKRLGVTLDEAVEQIDIGGPAMIRSAAKNWQDVAVIVSPETYTEIIAEMNRNDGALSLATRQRLARSAFERTSSYDLAVFSYLAAQQDKEESEQRIKTTVGSNAEEKATDRFAAHIELTLSKVTDLRYGENPHQTAALYDMGKLGVASASSLSGKEMSFNNYVDADAAWRLVCEFDEPACAIIKHTNPAGVAVGSSPEEAYGRALATDPVSAFGGIVAFNCKVNNAAAHALTEIFTEVVIAPDYDEVAFETLRAKKNLRILQVNALPLMQHTELEYRSISGGMLIQTADTHRLTSDDLKVVTRRVPSVLETDSLLFAWTVCKHTKSNAIVYARDQQTVGVGAGQMSRVDAVRLGAMRAQLPLKDTVLASDAFFPFRDGVDEAAQHGITAIIQPGGSVRDNEVIAAANEHNLAMVFTNVRHFKH